ncbi:non-canonical purine NTP pyrophosphatase [Pyxidicoccus parkwayensis]|uniref:Non-canonical purine NTP pyrophosphatase n=1 Tax=Pyxidicoccus parkwayensis TaxID=2813578 RepID=A0ABX7NQ37_9BACT|nr:non-canonical purine NTP pyrophosphatase [Pyxidicoccus parkwaysis]QSQ19690.1 non-canonical purine NTP pyrophosphatase [Pyxidicoccus parkwaysis]
MKTAYYLTSNANKLREVEHLFKGSTKLGFVKARTGVTEILETDLRTLVLNKAAAAYARVRYPIIVEHGAFGIEDLGGLPGTLIRPFWETLEGGICALVRPDRRRVTLKSAVCFCDGRQRKVILKEVEGTLADAPRGKGGFHWDPIFIPKGHTKTFAEIAEASLDDKLSISAAGLAYAELKKELGL